MECNKYKEMISVYLDGELSPEEKHELNGHLADCPVCRKFKAEMEELHSIALEREESPLPNDLEKDILNNISVISRRKTAFPESVSGYYKIPRWATWAAAAAILVLLYSAIWQPLHTRDIKVQPVESSPQEGGWQKVQFSQSDVVKEYTVTNQTVNLRKGK